MDYWLITATRMAFVVVVLALTVFGLLKALRKIDKKDTRYCVSRIRESAVATAIFAGLREAAIIFGTFYVVGEGIKACLL